MGTFLHKHESGRAAREQARPQGAEWVGDVDKKSTVGEGQGGCFLTLHFFQAPWRPHRGPERSPLGPRPSQKQQKRNRELDLIEPAGAGVSRPAGD